jgi:DeoR family transcriptional regulator, suf operon transcriptional repressor
MSATTATTDTSPPAGGSRSLVSLLGERGPTIVEHLHRNGDASVAELAAHLGISEVATRRHLGVLEDEGLVAARRSTRARGRPAARYR